MGIKGGKYDFKKQDAVVQLLAWERGGPGNASSSSGSYRLKLARHESIDVSPLLDSQSGFKIAYVRIRKEASFALASLSRKIVLMCSLNA
ncbi:hypothetical protein G5I_01094 [Acromyrmex echinatior]|uniref:Uncharacterized protein n=1 Tax=Acromyrmex echinatior TaxID=103372 RepID=F4W6K0_ACREC|nr:hypothetical protein G5I_01094 [Acromyrmex echinatior]